MTKKTADEIEKGLRARYRDIKGTHDWSHVQRVWKNAKLLTKKGGYNLDLELLRIMCLVHDITWTRYDYNMINYFREGRLAKETAGKYLKGFEISQDEINLILEAVSHHHLSLPFRRLNKKRSLYAQILQDADTLDYFHHERVIFWFKYIPKPMRRWAEKIIKYWRSKIYWFVNMPELV